MTDKEMLEQINNAISAIAVSGQSYSIGSRSLTRANLSELRATKADLEARIAADERGDHLLYGTSAVFFEGR